MTWNKRYDQFATLCGLRQSSEKLERWILRRAKSGEVSEIEIDLRVFNQEIARNRDRGGYDRKTLKEAIAQLDEKTQGHVLITKSYTWAIHKILVRPLEMVLEKKSQNGDNAPKLKTGNPMFSAEHKKRARELLLQNISRLDALFQKLGMKYTQDALMRIWSLADNNLMEIKGAIEYMLTCHARKLEQSAGLNDGSQGVTIPRGWLYKCLEHRWHHKDEEAILPYLEGEYIYSFVDSLMGTIPPPPK